MTRSAVYGVSFLTFLVTVGCSFASTFLPYWVAYTSPSDHDPVHASYGLFKRCTSTSGTCSTFPTAEDCDGTSNRGFCTLWRTTGFLMSLGLIIQLACVVAYITVLAGGRGAREVGWKVVSPLLGVVALCQLLAMALVAYSFDHDERFFIGWELARSWILCTVAWTITLLNAAALLSACLYLPYEDDYEPI